MGGRLPWYLLAASLAVNVFFLAGLAFPQLFGVSDTPTPDPVAVVAEELELSAAQRADLVALRGRVAERRAAAGGNGGSFRALLIAELAKPAFDRAGLEARMQDRRAIVGKVVLDVAEDLHGYLATLSPEQKAAFLEKAKERAFLRRLLWPRRETANNSNR
ncbi:periplasmic heavy metal sensor [Pelagibius sp.]|uniref:periplasmic heavy metal sensor n=1 Tax=Pelagibius sp. TaxID=1931238 RepID=UPI00262FDD51|nr:periplasmic heavy metal sensor [Pelagibius sp.]